MALTPRLEMRQGQSLVMTPQLQQAIKLLQFSNLELAAYVEAELEKNPLLERARDESERADGEAPVSVSEALDTRACDVAVQSENHPVNDAEFNTNNDNANNGESPMGQGESAEAGGTMDWSSVGSGGGTSFSGQARDLEATLSDQLSLRDHLLEQLNVATSDPTLRLIGSDLIDQIDEGGYFRGAVGDVAMRLGAAPEAVEQVLKTCQAFEPTGVMARDLGECLALQLAEKDRLDPAMVRLLANLELLAKHDLQSLVRICELDADDVVDMISEIRALNPKPGLSFGGEAAQTVVPDVFVRQASDGSWRVELNSDTLPRVLVDSHYYAEVSGKTKDVQSRTFLTECYSSANWLIKSLDQRAKTILKVAIEIVKQQDGFFAHGVQHLRPLNLKTVADAIEMHESTVSRVTSNKYMATSRGIFELKYFFTSSIQSTGDGEAHSAEAVRHRIKGLIDAETLRDVLSDDRIVTLLKSDGIDIARRTVAKYREAMRIPSSVQRRRAKKASA